MCLKLEQNCISKLTYPGSKQKHKLFDRYLKQVQKCNTENIYNSVWI